MCYFGSMSLLPKESLERLPEEHQQRLAEMELSRLKKRKNLQDQVLCRTLPWVAIVIGSGMFPVFLLITANSTFSLRYVVSFFAALIGIQSIHIFSINRKLDALIELQKEDLARDKSSASTDSLK